jgi:predicted kinase
MTQTQLSQDVESLRQSLHDLPEPMVNPAFIVVSGLPGTGKSFFCRKLAERCGFQILESDATRKVLFQTPNYSSKESNRLFAACHALIEQLLRKGIPIIFDATNLSERNRERLFYISDRAEVKLILVQVKAPSEVVYQRLQARKNGVDPQDKSDADWNVYLKMQPAAGKIRHNHFVVDTSKDITPAIDKIMRVINH